MTRTARPFLALATATLAILATLALLFSMPANAVDTRPLVCRYDASRPQMCQVNMDSGMTLDIDVNDMRMGTGPRQVYVVGNIEIPTAGDPVVLFEAHAELKFDSTWSSVSLVNGTALMPFPTQGFLQHIEARRTPIVSFGSDLGANLAFTGAPVHADQRYWYFHMNSILELGYGPISMTSPGGSATAILDPGDPYFYFGGELVGLGDKKKDESDTAGNGDGNSNGSGDGTTGDGSTTDGTETADNGDGADPNAEEDDGSIPAMGLGFSLNGRIPFTPVLTYGVEDELPEFDGHLYVRGPIPLPSFPMLSLTGDAVLDVDPDEDGDHPFEPTFYDGGFADMALGVNGELGVGIPFLKFFEFGFDLGSATTVISIRESDQRAVFTGEVGVDQSSFLGDLPVGIEAAGRVAVYGLFEDDLERSFIHGEGEMGLNPSAIGDLFGVELGPIAAPQAMIDINAAGLTVTGTTSSSPLPILSIDDAGVEAHVSPNGLDSYLALIGNFRLDTFELRNGRFEAHIRNGITVVGEVQIENTVFGMNGTFGLPGYSLTGTTELADPIALNVNETLELANLLLENENSRKALEDSLVIARDGTASAKVVFDLAQALVTAAQNEVNSIQSGINTNVSKRNSAKSSYDSWGRKSCGWSVSCAIEKAAKRTYYWGRYTYYKGIIGTLSLAKTAATAALTLAKNGLAAPQAILNTANAGVTTLLAELDTIAAATADIQQRLDALPDIEGELRPIVTIVIDNGDVSGTVVGEWNGQQITEGRVTFGANPVACLTIPTAGELCSPL